MHAIGHDVVQQPLVVGDDHDGAVGAAQGVDAGGNRLERVDVEPRVGFVEDGQGRVEHRHLKNLVSLLLAARKALVDGTADEALVQVHQLDLFPNDLHELHGVQLFLASMLAYGIHGGLQKIDVAHSGDLHRILKGHEDAFAGPFLGLHVQQVPVPVENTAPGHFETFPARQHLGQGALARPVGTHDGVHFSRRHFQVHPFQDRLPLHFDVQIFDLQHYVPFPCLDFSIRNSGISI